MVEEQLTEKQSREVLNACGLYTFLYYSIAKSTTFNKVKKTKCENLNLVHLHFFLIF